MVATSGEVGVCAMDVCICDVRDAHVHSVKGGYGLAQGWFRVQVAGHGHNVINTTCSGYGG